MSANQTNSEAKNLTLVAPSGGVTTGLAYLIGNLFGVALQTALVNENFVLQTQGSYTIPKLSTDVVSAGDLLYWDNTNRQLTKQPVGNYLVGAALSTSGSGATTVECRIDGTAIPMVSTVSDGANMTIAAPTGGVTAGDGVLIGGAFGVALETAAQTVNFTLQTKGVFSLPKPTTLVISKGDVLYWDVADGEVNKTAADNYRVGVATTAAANPSSTVSVKLDGVSVVVEPGA